MKRVNLICTITLMAFFLFGCLPSLHPIYTDDTVIFDEQLIGKWYADGGTWSFTKSGDKQYTLHIVEEDGKQATLDVHLVQLGEHTFIDLYPGENMELENTAEFYSFHLVPAHTFMKVELSEPNLNLQWVCLKDIIEDDPNRLKHERFENDSILITADSEDIQRVLLDNLDKVIEEDETTEFKRCPELFTVKNIVYDAELTGHWQADDGEYVDIIEWGHLGYDVIYSDGSQEVKKMKAVLYQRGHRTFLGLYVSAVCETQEKPETLLTPDFLAEIQLNESGLKIWFIDWSESEDWLDHNQKSAQGNIPEPNCLFRKTLL